MNKESENDMLAFAQIHYGRHLGLQYNRRRPIALSIGIWADFDQSWSRSPLTNFDETWHG